MRATITNHDKQRTDSALIEAFYHGEDDALSVLSERLYPKLRGLALSRIPRTEVGRYQLAEDFVQETFIKVAATKDRPLSRWKQGKSTVTTWIGTILKNLIHSHLRTKKIEFELPLICGRIQEIKKMKDSKIILLITD